MRPNRTQLAVSLLLLLALYLRLRGLTHMEFKGDERQALQLGLDLLSDHPWTSSAPWPQTGMLSSVGVANAPFFNYVMALFWALTDDPVAATALVALCNWLCLPALYVWARRRIDPARSLVLLALLAVSPFAVAYSRKLWAQDLLLPGITIVLFGLDHLRGPSFWRGVGITLIGLLPVTQLHQTGPIFAVCLAVAVPIQMLLDRRDRRFEAIALRPGLGDSALIALALAAHAFFLIPYVQYLLALPPEVLANRARLPALDTQYLGRLLAHALPVDLLSFIDGDERGFFRDRETTGTLGWLASNVGYFGALVTGAPLLLQGVWHWFRSPRAVAYLGLGWALFIVVFIALRIPAFPHYVLILYPLPFLLMADGFRVPGREATGNSLVAKLGRGADTWLPRVRWAHVALLFTLTLSFQSWLFARGGSPGDYGVAYSQRLTQTRELLGRVPSIGPRDDADTGPTRPPADPTLLCRKLPGEVVFLLAWLAPDMAAPPRSLALCEGWGANNGGARQHRWELIE